MADYSDLYIPTKDIKIEDVKDTLNEDTMSLAKLCSSTKINKWSFNKPHKNGLSTTGGLDILRSSDPDRLCCNGYTNSFIYSKPSLYNLTHFSKYYHRAEYPFVKNFIYPSTLSLDLPFSFKGSYSDNNIDFDWYTLLGISSGYFYGALFSAGGVTYIATGIIVSALYSDTTVKWLMDVKLPAVNSIPKTIYNVYPIIANFSTFGNLVPSDDTTYIPKVPDYILLSEVSGQIEIKSSGALYDFSAYAALEGSNIVYYISGRASTSTTFDVVVYCKRADTNALYAYKVTTLSFSSQYLTLKITVSAGSSNAAYIQLNTKNNKYTIQVSKGDSISTATGVVLYEELLT